MKNCITIILILLGGFTYAQINLVPNPSFEDTVQCPNGVSQLANSLNWFQPTLGTPDYFNACALPNGVNVPDNVFGYQNAITGFGYAGFFACIVNYDTTLLYREYCEVKLDSALQAGVEYFITFYVSLADSMNYATDAVGAWFSTDTAKNDTGYFISSIIPQVANTPGFFLTDKTGWTKISGKFTPAGGERFLTIANFKDPFNTYTVSVPGGSLNIGQSDWWGGYYYLDDVCVSTDSLYCETWTGIHMPSASSKAIIYLNPAYNHLAIKNHPEAHFTLANTIGEIILKGAWKENTSIDVSKLESGMYFLMLDEKEIHKVSIIH